MRMMGRRLPVDGLNGSDNVRWADGLVAKADSMNRLEGLPCRRKDTFFLIGDSSEVEGDQEGDEIWRKRSVVKWASPYAAMKNFFEKI